MTRNAFPHYTQDAWGRPVVTGGMSLRQYYAAQAMQALIARTGIWGEDELVASKAFRIADAMLEEEKRCSSPATSTT